MRTAILATIVGFGLVGGMAAANAAPPWSPSPPPGWAYGNPYAVPPAGYTCPPGYFFEAQHYDKWGRFWQTGCIPNGY